jgi:hypothetical protein
MTSKLTIHLDITERNALRKLARQERREIRQQVAVIIRDDLIRRGLLPLEGDKSDNQKPQRDALMRR